MADRVMESNGWLRLLSPSRLPLNQQLCRIYVQICFFLVSFFSDQRSYLNPCSRHGYFLACTITHLTFKYYCDNYENAEDFQVMSVIN